ncbi:type 1 fimbrial protein, partial [Escherichia coli]
MSAGNGVLLVICLLFLPLKSALSLNCYFGSSGCSVYNSEAIQPFAV